MHFCLLRPIPLVSIGRDMKINLAQCYVEDLNWRSISFRKEAINQCQPFIYLTPTLRAVLFQVLGELSKLRMFCRPWSPELMIYRGTDNKRVYLILLSEGNLQWQFSIDSLLRVLICGGTISFKILSLSFYPFFSLHLSFLSPSTFSFIFPSFILLFTFPHSFPYEYI